MQTKNCQIEIEVKTINQAGEFEGYAAVYDTVDMAGDAISAGAFTKTLAEGSADLPLLWQHDQSQPIGRVRLIDSPKGLIAKGRLILSVPKAQEVYTLLMANIVKGLSIGFRTVKESFSGSVRRLKEIQLFEVSVVTLPCNPDAVIMAVKSQESARDLEAVEAFRNAARDIREFHRGLVE